MTRSRVNINENEERKYDRIGQKKVWVNTKIKE